MEINSQTNTFEGGMDMDTDVTRTASNTYRYAQNVRLITNEDGTNGILLSIEYIKKYSKIDALSNLNILHVIAARIPDENELLQNTAILLTLDKTNIDLNNIYLVTGFTTQLLSCKCVIKIIWHMTSENNVTMIYNYETRNVYKLYVNDPATGLKIINLADYTEEWGDKDPIDNTSYFNSQPNAELPPLTLEGYISGNLKAGAYLYFYKLYTNAGVESTLSAGSEVIYLGRPNITEGSLAEGYTEEYTTNYGIQLRINVSNNYFNRIRLYRVYWKDNLNLPTVDIITEDRVTQTNLNYTINDSVQQSISSLTLEEFNDFIPYTFLSQIMTLYKNRLFFANLESSGWDIPEDYDTRAYRANYNGKVTLNNATGSAIINNVNLSDIVNGTVKVDSTADCINPMNILDLYPDALSNNEYAYDTGKSYGGEGPNIEFHLVFGETYETPKVSNIPQNATTTTYDNISSPGLNSNAMKITAANGSKTYPLINFGSWQLLSYANPYIASKFASYQRDEVYRFGIVFYNEKFVASPVHWICDIRIPSGDTAGFLMFDVNKNSSYEVISKPIGINFAIKANKFPEGAVAAEIVRCDRTQADRSIVAQGMLNNPVFYWHANMHVDSSTSGLGFDANISNGMNDIRAPFFPTMDELPQGTFHAAKNLSLILRRCYDTKIFASPEVSMNPTADIINEGDYICPVRAIWAVHRNADNADYLKVCYEDSTTTTTTTFGVIRGDTGEALLCFDTPNGANTTIGVVKYYCNESANDLYKNNGPSSGGKTANSQYFIANINSAKVARTNLPVLDNGGINAFKNTYIDNINSRLYTNNAVGSSIFSVAGINELLGVDFPSNATRHILYKAYAISSSSNASSWANVRSLLVNIKRRVTPYGGNSYLARAANSYISCGGYISKSSASKTVFGGDTFLSIFNYQHAIPFTKNDYSDNPNGDNTSGEGNGVYFHQGILVYLPIESTINTYMRSDEYYAKLAKNNSNLRFYLQTNPGVINANTQATAMYQYNSVYSLSDGALNYVMGSTNENISSTEYNRYRICCTELKSAGEEVDSWSITKFANTLDLDFRYGQINNLIDFNSRLYAILESAVSVVSVDDRALITDLNGAELVLGTGGILNRYDILVYNYGTGNSNDKSVITSSLNIYWYDCNKNVLCALGNNGFHLLSKEKKVQTYLNSIAQVGKVAFTAVFNDRQNELWMTTKGAALVYSEQADLFTSFYTHTPNWGLRFYDRLVTLDSKLFYYTDTFGEEDIVKKMDAKVTFTVNQDPLFTKVFDNQWLSGNLEDPNNTSPQNISSVKFHTKTQDSFETNYENIECREDTYRFAIPRQDRGLLGSDDEAEQDTLNRSFLPRMRGKYMICEYTFDCDNDRSIEIPFIKTTYRLSKL